MKSKLGYLCTCHRYNHPCRTIHCCYTVSYTHLDVYKRQAQTALSKATANETKLNTIPEMPENDGKIYGFCKDVYKRQILHHAIMRVIEEDVYRNLIYDTSACIKGKGLHFGVRR